MTRPANRPSGNRRRNKRDFDRPRRNAIDSSLGSRDDALYGGEIVGYIRRDGGEPERTNAERIAKTMPWWEAGLVLDPRDQKWWCWRRRTDS